jgi:ABC-type sugar transport system substrate-binding protein
MENIYLKSVKIFFAVMFLLFSQISFATKVIFIIPDEKGPAFWRMVHDVSAAAAKSLGVQLEVIYGGANRFATLEIIEGIVARPIKPDYLIFRPFHGNAESIFDLIEARGILFVTLEQAFSRKEALQLQRPKQKYKHWIGEVAYDNANGGVLLLDALLKAHRLRHPAIEPAVIGIGGDFDNLSVSRQQVLTNLERSDDVRINQIFPSYWDPKIITNNFEMMLERYPETNIFWCAGDQLAIEIFEQHHLLSMTSIIVGGFDWLPDALLKIQQGELTASVGGHFLMGAIAITKIIDYQNGTDRFLSQSSLYNFEVITQENVNSYLDFIQQRKWREVNFNQFLASKLGHQTQPLNVQNIIKSIKE